GPQEDRADRRRQYRRHPRPPDRPQAARRCRHVRRVPGRRGGQGARHHAIRPGRRVRFQHGRDGRLCRHRRRRCGDRHRRLPAHAGDEPRRPADQECRRHGPGGRGHQDLRPRRLRHLHHQPARRHGLGAAAEVGPAGAQGRRHGRRAGQQPLPPLPRPGVQRLGRGRDGLRARRPWRHHGAADPLLHRRRHPRPRPRQDGLDDAGEDRRHRQPHRQWRRRDREAAGEGLGLLRPGRLRHRHGRGLSARQEAGAALRRDAERRVRPQRLLCRRAGRHRRRRRGAHRRGAVHARGEGRLRQVLRRSEEADRGFQEARRL
ncbi:MAG: Malate dehydrogenase, partial [uncultured Craurococcus sp.]